MSRLTVKHADEINAGLDVILNCIEDGSTGNDGIDFILATLLMRVDEVNKELLSIRDTIVGIEDVMYQLNS